MSSLEIAVKLPPGIPSITINGLVLPDNELTPRIVISSPNTGSPV